MKAKLFSILKITLAVSAIGCAATVLWAGVHYLRTDPRYNIRQITVLGIKHVEEEDVMSRIQLNPASNTNIFSVDLDEVRLHVEQISWVRYASVQRILPDRIIITVSERAPIGLARIDGRVAAFDADGAILEPDDSDKPFPILIGLSRVDSDGNLKKIALYSKATTELGDAGLSEVIVDQGDVSVVRDIDPQIVNLGSDAFRERWDRYMALKSRIDESYKDAVRVDLRIRNQVIVKMQDDEDGGKVIWDGKKKSL